MTDSEAPSPAGPPRIAVCVATYKRPSWLERTLRSIAGQRFEGPVPDVRVLVVDNDPEATGRPVVERLAAESPWPTSVLVEPTPGISPARNAAVAAIEDWADAIVFIDDDEWAEPTWLEALVRAWDGGRNPAINGPVFPVPESEPPAWVRRAGLLDPFQHPDGSIRPYGATGNALVSVETLKEVCPRSGGRTVPFDLDMSLSGGADTMLFARLAAAGAPTVWAADAVVHETIPARRWTLEWQTRRAFRTGTTMTLMRLRVGRGPGRIAHAIAAGGAWIALGLLRLPAGIAGRHQLVRGLRHLGYGAGVLAGLRGRGFREYAHARRESAADLGRPHHPAGPLVGPAADAPPER